MTELYKEAEAIVMFEKDCEEELRTEKFLRFMKATRWIYLAIIILTVLFMIWWTFSQQHLMFVLYFAFVILCIVGIYLYKRKFMKNMFYLQFTACNMKKALTVYLVILRNSKEIEKSDAGLYGIGSVLLCMGEFDKAIEIANLIERYTNTATSKVYALIIRTSAAFYKKETETLESCIEQLGQMAAQNATPFIRPTYNMASEYPEILKFQENLDYAGALELLSKEEYNRETLSKVSSNYRLYRIAKDVGMEQEAARHKEFVLANGGDSFYCKNIENE